MVFFLPQSVKTVLNRCHENGFPAYLVGGCVRDLLMGTEPHDYDIATAARPEQITGLFEKTFTTGLKHGTVTVVEQGMPIEVTTFRTESVYTDYRRPDTVTFIENIREDLARRDFTVNALGYNEQEGILDYFSGQQDLKNRILRAVGEPRKRFCEDALRILRLFRFAATLSFTIEPQTEADALACAPLLAHISGERIFAELQKTVCGADVGCLLPLLECNGLQSVALQAAPLDFLPRLPAQPDLRMAGFLLGCTTDLPATLAALKCSNRFAAYCLHLQCFSKTGVPADATQIKRLLQQSDETTVADFLQLLQAHGINVEKTVALLQQIIDTKQPYRTADLKINGTDLAALGLQGKKIGTVLRRLTDVVLEDASQNTRENLLRLAAEQI